MNRRGAGREIALGGFVVVLAAGYFAAAAALPVSLLTDEVGASGVPKLLAVSLGILGAMQLGRTVLFPVSVDLADGPRGAATHARAFGMLAIGTVYTLATPYLGYPVALAALIFVVAAYVGLRPSPRLGLVAVTGALFFWFTFVKLLGISMPVGAWRWAVG